MNENTIRLQASGWLTSFAILSLCVAAYSTHLLGFSVRGDEVHFWHASRWLFESTEPWLRKLQTYNELNTPLPFLIFGGLDRWFGTGIDGGRAVNLAASLGTLAIIVSSGPARWRSIVCAIGLVTFPYFSYLGVLLYTDPLAVFFATAGVAFSLRGANLPAALCFVLGISCRQYIVAFPVALIAFRYIRSSDDHGTPWLWISALSLVGWYGFFGGPGPLTAVNAQAIKTSNIYPDHAVYYLTSVGAYYVIVEAVLFRRFEFRIDRYSLALAAVVACAFVVFPPVENVNTVTDTMGYLDRALRIAPDWLRLGIFLCLALATVFRFSAFTLPGLIVYANTTLMLFAHVAWDKYALPAIAVLWLLKSTPAWSPDTQPRNSGG